jgi:hypothetical protein
VRSGEIWTGSAGTGYVGKQRPVVIVQDDRFDATKSITVCAFTTDPTEAPLFRLRYATDRTVLNLTIKDLHTYHLEIARLRRRRLPRQSPAGPVDTTGLPVRIMNRGGP